MRIYDTILSKTQLVKGWSNDKKFCVITTDGTKYLLRITPIEKSANREEMFRMMKQVEALDVPMNKPIEYGTCEHGVYALHTWIEGNDALDVIPSLSEAMQYNYGLEAGHILKTMHSIQASPTQENWETRFNRKMDRNIKVYNDCSFNVVNHRFFIEYIQSNRHLLKGRPQTFQHGDYHIGNMIIDNNNQLHIIDFDRYDFGDPWEEFNRIVFSAQKSALFASGIVNGYFDNEVPMEFWKLLALYISSNMLSAIPWAIPFGQSEIDFMIDQANEVLQWYDHMQNLIPSWYHKGYQSLFSSLKQ